MLSVIIPAYNEQDVIADCLRSLLAQNCTSITPEILVAANGCTDNTVRICQSFKPEFEGRGFSYRVIDIEQGSKNNALNSADDIAQYPARLYLDADVTCEPDLLQQAAEVIENGNPLYFSGTLLVPEGESCFSNAYGKIWAAMPYVRDAVTGIGCYGVNAAGRKLWGKFPSIHSDDKFVRMLFKEEQCIELKAAYQWPVPQGLLTLIKVRTRWIKGNHELRSRFPHLHQDSVARVKTDRQSITTMLTNPLQTVTFLVIYAAAALLAIISRDQAGINWSRAR